MEGTIITLPSAEEMRKRLIAVEDDVHFRQELYPLLIEQAGEERSLQGVVMMLLTAVEDCSEKVPPAVGLAMDLCVPQLINAVVLDPAAAQETCILHERTLERSLELEIHDRLM